MSVDLVDGTHLKMSHVVALIIGLATALTTIGGVYLHFDREMNALSLNQKGIPTNKDLEKTKTDIETNLTHTANDRVKFYMEHADLECPSAPKGKKQHCKIKWPPETE